MIIWDFSKIIFLAELSCRHFRLQVMPQFFVNFSCRRLTVAYCTSMSMQTISNVQTQELDSQIHHCQCKPLPTHKIEDPMSFRLQFCVFPLLLCFQPLDGHGPCCFQAIYVYVYPTWIIWVHVSTCVSLGFRCYLYMASVVQSPAASGQQWPYIFPDPHVPHEAHVSPI